VNGPFRRFGIDYAGPMLDDDLIEALIDMVNATGRHVDGADDGPADEIERLRAALREIRALHQPEWASEQAKAAGKEPWVCSLCGTADGGWPCDTIDMIREVLGDE